MYGRSLPTQLELRDVSGLEALGVGGQLEGLALRRRRAGAGSPRATRIWVSSGATSHRRPATCGRRRSRRTARSRSARPSACSPARRPPGAVGRDAGALVRLASRSAHGLSPAATGSTGPGRPPRSPASATRSPDRPNDPRTSPGCSAAQVGGAERARGGRAHRARVGVASSRGTAPHRAAHVEVEPRMDPARRVRSRSAALFVRAGAPSPRSTGSIVGRPARLEALRRRSISIGGNRSSVAAAATKRAPALAIQCRATAASDGTGTRPRRRSSAGSSS